MNGLNQESLNEYGNIDPYQRRFVIVEFAAKCVCLIQLRKTHHIGSNKFNLGRKVNTVGAQRGVDILTFNLNLLIVTAIVFFGFLVLGMKGAGYFFFFGKV